MPPPASRSVARRPAPPAAAVRALALILVAALGVGAAAALLPSTAPAPVITPTVIPGLSLEAFLWGCAGLLLLLVGYFAFARARSGSVETPLAFLLPFLAIFLVALVFLAALHLAPTGPPSGTVARPGNNSTGHGVPPPPPVNRTNLTNATLPFFPGVPPWVYYALLGVVAAGLVGLFAAVRLRAARAPPTDAGAERSAASVPLQEALRALATGGSTDPRSVVIALYARLLRQMEPRHPTLASSTPREIERWAVDRLRVGASTARTLTDIFEEARYSSHPLTPARVEEARTALRGALADLGSPESLA